MFVTFKKSTLLASAFFLAGLPFTAFGQEVDDDDEEIIFISHGPTSPQFEVGLEFNAGPPSQGLKAEDIGLYGDFKVVSANETHGPKGIPFSFEIYDGADSTLNRDFPAGSFTLTVPGFEGQTLEFEVASATSFTKEDALNFEVAEFPGVRFSEARSNMVDGTMELEDGTEVSTKRYFNNVIFRNDTTEAVTLLYIDKTGENYVVLADSEDDMPEEDGMVCWYIDIPAGGTKTLNYAIEKWEVA